MNLQQKSRLKFHCGYNWFFLSLVNFYCFSKRAEIKFFALLLCSSTLCFLLHLCSIAKDNLWRCVVDIFKRVWINICSNLNLFIFIPLKCNSFLPALGWVCLLPSIARLIPPNKNVWVNHKTTKTTGKEISCCDCYGCGSHMENETAVPKGLLLFPPWF